VTSSPSFDSFFDPQQGQLSGAEITTRSRGRIWEGLTGGLPALERLDRLCARRRLLRRQFVFGGRRFQLFELKLHLFQQASLALRAGAIELAPQLLDLELEMADERFRARQIRLGVGRFGTSNGEPGLRFNAGGALGKDQRVRSGKIGGKRFAGGHTTMESHPSPSASQKHHPTDVGRHVSCGCLQSMPDRR
jgi:hypothetical protein